MCVCLCLCLHQRGGGSIQYAGGGFAAAAAGRDLMLMRSVMGVNMEREGNRLGLHRRHHSPYALQYA